VFRPCPMPTRDHVSASYREARPDHGLFTLLFVLSIVVNAAFLAAYPIWSTILIAVDILVIWALTVHGDEMRTMLEARER